MLYSCTHLASVGIKKLIFNSIEMLVMQKTKQLAKTHDTIWSRSLPKHAAF